MRLDYVGLILLVAILALVVWVLAEVT